MYFGDETIGATTSRLFNLSEEPEYGLFKLFNIYWEYEFCVFYVVPGLLKSLTTIGATAIGIRVLVLFY